MLATATGERYLLEIHARITVSQAVAFYRNQLLLERWKELGTFILTKYNDGYVRTPEKGTEGVEYPEAWLRRLLEENPDQFRVPDWGQDPEE